MNTQQKQKILNKFLSELSQFQKQNHKRDKPIPIAQFDTFKTPDIDLISDLISHQRGINEAVDQTFKSVKGVLTQLSELQTRKENINKLLDSMTAIKDVKRLSYGLGATPQQIYKNLVVYYQVKGKLHFCEKYIEKVEQQISKIKTTYQNQLEQQLRKANSENITDIAKTLNLISQNNNQEEKATTSDHIVKFYVDMVRKQLQTYQDDLLKIPINGSNSAGSYVFFDVAKDAMKLVVMTLNNYKGNIVKIGGEETYQKVIVQIFDTVMKVIILQIFVRQKKYFQVDSLDSKKICKESSRFKDYLNQFCAIWNQVERLKAHFMAQVPLFSPNFKAFQNNLSNCTNTGQLLKINSQTSEGLITYTRYQFNNLLKSSPFVNSLYQHDYDFLTAIANNFIKENKDQYESPEAHEFLLETFSIIIKSLEKTFQSLNMLSIISPFIRFVNNNLIKQDAFHAFNELFNKALPKMVTKEAKFYTTIIILLNTVILMPGALRAQLSTFKIPSQLDNHKIRLESELKQLGLTCQERSKEIILDFIDKIVSSSWFSHDLRQDYKKAIEKWKGLTPEVNEIFLFKISQLHSSLILADQFNLKAPKKTITQQGIISLQKQIRNIINFYQVKGCSALNSFRIVLEYIEVMLAENDQSAKKLCIKFGITNGQEIQKLTLLRAMKVD